MTRQDPEQLRQEIRRALAEHRWADAAELLERWTRRFPDQAHPRWVRAVCLERCGEEAAALEAARRAHSLAPDDPRYAELAARLEGPPAGDGKPAAGRQVERGEDAPPTLGEEVRSLAADDGHVAATLVDGRETAPAAPGPTLVDHPPEVGPAHGGGAATSTPGPTAVDARDGVERTAVEDEWATLREGDRGARRRDGEAPAGWAEGSVIEGRYEVRGTRRGGMGEVYFVHDRELGMDIAVKTPLPSALATEAGRQRFLREAEAWVALGLHPNICSAYYVREIGGVPRLFIEYVEGGSLEEWLRRRGDSPIEDRLDLAVQVAAGMEHAHTFRWSDEDEREHRGLVHRDLKPANVLVGGDGLAKVTDFGLVGRDLEPPTEGPEPAADSAAGSQESTGVPVEPGASQITSIWQTMTLAGRVMGSPVYMAPEQWRGAHLAGRPADIYAFGCILYELLTGRRPFVLDPRYREADPKAQLAFWRQAHCSRPPADPRSLAPDLDPETAALMLACLAKDPAQRPPSFARLSASLRKAYPRLVGREYPRPPVAAVALPADSLNNRGVSFVCLGQHQRARRAWREALGADPRHPHATCNLALADWRQEGATDQEVARRLAEVRRGDAGDWQRALLSGRVLLALGDYAEALECLRAAASASGDAAEAVRDLAFALCAVAWETGDEDLWRQIVALLSTSGSPLQGDPAMLVCHTVACLRVGDAEGSRRLWAEAARNLEEPPPTVDAAASLLLPGTQLLRRTDLPLGRITAVAVGREGATVAFGTESGAVAVLDAATGEVRTLRGHGARIRAMAVLPRHGAILAAEEGQPLAAWDLATGNRRGLQAHTGYLNALVVDAEERFAAGASSAGAVVLWDLSSLRRTAVVPAHSGYATCVALSGDAGRAVSGGADGNLVVVDVARQGVTATLAAHPGGVRAVALSPDGRLALSGGADGLCLLWDLDRGAQVATLRGHGGAVTFAALAADGARALSAAADGTLRHWDLTAGRVIKSERTGGAVTCAAAAADWTVVAAAHGTTLSQYGMAAVPGYRPPWAVAHLVTSSEADERARGFLGLLAGARTHLERDELAAARDLAARAREIPGYERAPDALQVMAQASAPFPRRDLADGWEERVLRAHHGPITAMAVAAADDRVASCGGDRRLVLWDWRRGETVNAVETTSPLVASCVLGSSGLVAAADMEGTVRVVAPVTGAVHGTFEGHQGKVHGLACDPAGRLLLSAGSDGTARLWDPAAGACLRVLEGHLGQVLACAVGPDGRLCATGDDQGALLLWDTSGGHGASHLEGHAAPVRHLEWSEEGRYLLSAGADAVRLWDARTGRCLRSVESDGPAPTCAALTADARFTAVGEAGGRVALWHLRDRRLLRLFEGHAGAVTAVGFTPDTRRLLSAGADGTLRVWYLDWEPEIRDLTDWDESARPHLELFLARHTPVEGGPPRWSSNDVDGLLRDLQRRGLGWVRPQGVASMLDTLARRPAPRPSRRRPPSRLTPRTRQGLRRGRLGALGAVLVMAPLLFLGTLLWSHRQLHLDAREARARRAHNLTIILAPTLTTGDAPCEPGKLRVYLQDYTRPTDSLKDWSAASHCLVELADPSTVAPLLALVHRPPVRNDAVAGMQIGSDPAQIMAGVRRAMSGGLSAQQAVESMLARMGQPVVHALLTHLDDDAEEVRNTAAAALALAGTRGSVDALAHRARDPNVLVRRAVARQITNLAVGERLEVEDAFALAEVFADDEDAQVRLAVADQLGIFAGRRPRALARRLVGDEDPEVARAALPHSL